SLDGAVHAPQGVRGGTAGAPAEAFIVRPDGGIVEVKDLIADRELKLGERMGSRSNGGGGYGGPRGRGSGRVVRDVVEGYVSLTRAREVYGVVIIGDPATFETLAVDEEATKELRNSALIDQASVTRDIVTRVDS